MTAPKLQARVRVQVLVEVTPSRRWDGCETVAHVQDAAKREAEALLTRCLASNPAVVVRVAATEVVVTEEAS